MADLTWAVDLAEELINEYGQDGTIVVFVPTTGDNPWDEGEPVETAFDCRVIFTRFDKEYVDGQLIHKEDRLALVAAKHMGTFEPNLKGEIRVPGQAWKIISIDQVQPAEQIIVYKFQVRL